MFGGTMVPCFGGTGRTEVRDQKSEVSERTAVRGQEAGAAMGKSVRRYDGSVGRKNRR